MFSSCARLEGRGVRLARLDDRLGGGSLRGNRGRGRDRHRGGFGCECRLRDHRFVGNSRLRLGLDRFRHVGNGRRRWLAPDLDPHVLSAPRGDDGEAIEDAVGRKDLVLDRAHLVEGALLIDRQNLGEHARDRVEGEHARRQLHLAPGERAAVGVHRRGRRDDVRLFADVHDERVAFEANDGVEQGIEQLHSDPCPMIDRFQPGRQGRSGQQLS